MAPTEQFFTFTLTEENILSDVKNIMRCVQEKLPDRGNELNKFLK